MKNLIIDRLLVGSCLMLVVLQHHECITSSPTQYNKETINVTETHLQGVSGNEKEMIEENPTPSVDRSITQKNDNSTQSSETGYTEEKKKIFTNRNQEIFNTTWLNVVNKTQLEPPGTDNNKETLKQSMADSRKTPQNQTTVNITVESDEAFGDVQNRTKHLKEAKKKNKSEVIQYQIILDTLTEICGEKYKPCKKEISGYKKFKKTSACKPCSCNPNECLVLRNCCPDVDEDSKLIAAMKDSKPKPKCKSLSTSLSPEHISQEDKEEINKKDNNEVKDIANRKAVSQATEKAVSKGQEERQTTDKLNITSLHVNIGPHHIFNDKKGKEDNASFTEFDKATDRVKDISYLSRNETGTTNKITDLGSEDKQSSVLAEKVYPLYSLIDYCPVNYHKKNTINFCENQASPLLLDNVPVYDWFSNRIYSNKWCAKCHSIYFPDLWKITTDCLHLYTLDYLPLKISDFFNLTQNCTVRVEPKVSNLTEVQECLKVENDENVVSTCNVTGQWMGEDKVIERLCTSRNYMSYYRGENGNQTTVYKNMFCYICNSAGGLHIATEGKKKQSSDKEYEERHLDMEVTSSNAGLQTQTWSKDGNKQVICQAGQIPDVYTDDCLQFVCPIHQLPLANACLNRHRVVTGLVIAATIHLDFQQPVYIGKSVNDKTQSSKRILGVLDRNMQVTASGCDIRYVRIFANYNLQIGHIKKLIMVIKLANTNRCSVEKLVGIFTELQARNISIFPGISTQYEVNRSTPLSEQKVIQMMTRLSFNPLKKHHFEMSLIAKPIAYEIRLTENFDCPRVLIPLTKYNKLAPNLSMPQVRSSIQEEKLIPICYTEYLQSWLSQKYNAGNVKSDDETTIEGTVSLCITIISMVCILLILITYLIFSELRFTPGKQFMVLCFNLLLANGFFDFGVGSGLKDFWCKFIGMCIHFFWLATMFSMSFNLWLILKHIQDPLMPENMAFIQSKSNYQVFKYAFYCYVMAMAFVLSNIVISSTVYNDKHYGYGDQLCYINTSQMRLITFGIPIAFVLLINSFMFYCIMSIISQKAFSNYSLALRSKVIVFMKLSTISGMYWAFGFIYEATQVKVFEYLFIIFNGGQGIFLMWSFFLNKHIFQLYRNACQKVFFNVTTRYYKKIGLKFKRKPAFIASEESETSC